MLSGMQGMQTAARELAGDNEVHAVQIAEFLRDVDVPISKIRVENNESSDKSDLNMLLKKESVQLASIFTHKTALGEADLQFRDESEGTKNLVGFWLPWITRNYKAHPRSVLMVDELDSSLHPKIVAALVEKHIHADQPSQLIFTTHDTHLMDANLLRRDQFWVTDRDINGATQLLSIHDFEGREGEDIEKRYYEGRYRGLPIVKRK